MEKTGKGPCTCPFAEASVGFRSRMSTSAPTADAGSPRPHVLPMALVTWAFIALVLLLVVALVVVKLTQGTSPTPHLPPLASVAVVDAVAGVPQGAFDSAGVSALSGPGPQVTSGQAPYQVDGKPAVVFVGAEFSPYSAAESWALVAALARFGTFSRLGQESSASDEVFGGTPGFSFDGTSYRSTHVTLEAVDTYESTLSSTAPAGFSTLEEPSASVLSLVRRYDGQDGDAVLPFLDVGGRVVVVGDAIGFSPGVLGSMSMSQVAGALTDPTSAAGQAILGAANELTAALCVVDGGVPTATCHSAATLSAASHLGLP